MMKSYYTQAGKAFW